MTVSILCVTKGMARAGRFLDHFRWVGATIGAEVVIAVDGVDVHSKGYIESVLDDAVALTKGDYVLRMDDDEKCSPAMIDWLRARKYRAADHWSFPRVHLWKNDATFIMDPPFYPDFQTRMSVRAKAGGRPKVHAPSPFGAGNIARVCIEHWPFLVKTQQEIGETSAFYQSLHVAEHGEPAVQDPHEISWPIAIGGYNGIGAMPLLPTWTGRDKIR